MTNDPEQYPKSYFKKENNSIAVYGFCGTKFNKKKSHYKCKEIAHA